MKRVLVAIVWMVLMLSTVSGVSEVLIQDTTSEFTDIETDTLSVNSALDVGGDLNVTGTAYIGDMTFDGDISLNDYQKLYMTTDKTKYIQYNDTLGGFLIGDSEDVLISAPDDVFITAGVGGDGGGSWTPAIALEDDFLYLDATGDSAEFIWISSYAYTLLDSVGDVRFGTGGDSDDYIYINTSGNVPYIGTVGNSNLKLIPSSGLVEVTGDLSLEDYQKLYMTTDKTKYIQYNDSLGGFLIGDSEDVLISAPDDVFITAGVGGDGGGSWTPAIALEDDFLYLDASGDSAEYIWISAYAYTRFESEGDVRFDVGGDHDDWLIINTSNNVPYISTVGNNDLRLTSSSGLVEVDGDLNVTGTAYIGDMTFDGDISLNDYQKLYMTTDKTKYIQYNDTLGGFLIGDSEDVLISAPDDVFITAGVGGDGGGSWTPAIALEDDFLLLDATGDSAEYIWLSSYAYTLLDSVGDVRFKTGGDSDDYIYINTSGNVPYIATAGSSNLKLSPSSGLVEVDGDLKVNNNVSLQDTGVIHLSTDKTKYIQYNSDVAGFLLEDTGDDSYLASPDQFFIYSHTGIDGGGDYGPGIEMYSNRLELFAAELDQHITFDSGSYIQFNAGDGSNYIFFNTTSQQPYISTVGNNNLRLTSSSGLVEVVGELNITESVQITNTTTGGNAGTDLCIDANGKICACGSCA